jgi:cytochrome c peroxidase
MSRYHLRSRLGLCFSLAGAALIAAGIDAQGTGPVARQADVGRPAVDSTSAAAELGRLLFWDPILSGSRDIACATCHHPDFAYADGRDLSLGTGSLGLGPARADASNGRIPVVKRNAPTLLNVAFNGLDAGRRRGGLTAAEATLASVDQARAPMFWDSRTRSLEAQALEPIKAREEMRGDAWSEATAVDAVVARLRGNPEYVALFEKAFGNDTAIDAQQLARAIAAFERTLVAMNSPFDRFRAGDANALTAQQRRGMNAFDDAGCDRCHEGPLFSDFELHAEGVREHPALSEPDAGTRNFRFRTPSLRNVALTAPYMHNGTLRTLDDVLRFYDNGRSENPNVSAARRGRRGGNDGNDGIARLASDFRRVDDMSDAEMRDIIAFLESLTDRAFDRTVPARVPSRLPPGGLIQPDHARR